MAYFSNEYGIIKEYGDCQWQKPEFVKDFFSFIVGQPPIGQPKTRKNSKLNK